jgi:hypothetical protein
MRSIAVHAFAFVALALTVLSTAALRGGDVVDATRPANAGDVEMLLRRIEQLERRLGELEARSPVAAPALPHPPVTTLPYVPTPRNDGVLRADQVKIFLHYQTSAPDVFAAEPRQRPVQPAGFRSGGITITR